ncbi:MAG: M24 family metallopeptidase [Gaiellaceae bacterium]
MATRLSRLQALIERPLLVTSGTNVRYLSGLSSSNAALLVEPERVRLFTDFRYLERASALEGVEPVKTTRNLLVSIAELIVGDVEFEAEVLTVAGLEQLSRGRARLLPAGGIVERMRAIKDEQELAAVRRAAGVTNGAFARLAHEPFVGRSERDLAWRVRELLHEEGADDEAFEPIVVSGPNGALPHADPGERVIGPGELVTVDAAARVDGYCSDCTRAFATGELPKELLRAFNTCHEAQLVGLEAVRAGASCRDADAAARARVDEGEFAGRFGHGLGHGVGLDIHELPVLRPESDAGDLLAAGNVVTVEPGIYLPGVGGLRIEDLVIVREDGVEVLTTTPKELLLVG